MISVADARLAAAVELIGVELGRVEAWQRDALCAEPAHQAVAFFPERGESSDPAKAVCRNCLVRVECLEYALDNGIVHGIWGGLSGRERRRVRHQRALESHAA